CGGASMIFDKIRRDWKTDYVIPFTLTKEQCKQAYVKEVKRHIFVSKKYRNPELIESFRGVYMPYWSYSTGVKGEFNITVDAHTRPSPTGNITIDRYSFKGTSDFVLSGYTHDASISFDDHLSEKLAPYDVTRQKPFNPAYLCGFYAEAGDADKTEYKALADEELRLRSCEVISSDPEVEPVLPNTSTLNYDTENSKLPFVDKKTKLALFPVWFMGYRRKNKVTYAAVNGQTGKVGADLPLSPLRILLAALIAAAAIFGLTYLVMHLLPSLKAKTTLGISTMLMMGGLFIMQNAFFQTVSNAIRMDKRKSLGARLSPRYFFLLAGCTTAIIIHASDGSYKGYGRIVGVIIFIILAIPLVQFHFAQARELKAFKQLEPHTESMLNNGIITTAKKLLMPLKVIRIIVYVTLVISLIGVMSDGANNSLYYLFCGIIAVELFCTSFLHIWFQATVAKRRPPQFDKKGAYYDDKKD
ncbi:MAG: hypothetical protein II190_05270, partial [Ruminococcus sp.]|nr:hypothetical protein [Ruminococcus sp.]